MTERLHLLIDADDTLWENNIYFEQAFDEFAGFLNHSSYAPAQVRAILDEIEIVNNKVHGYGSLNFGRNLRECYQRLCERQIDPHDLDHVMSIAERIMTHPIQIIDGVEDTLKELCQRHDLTLFTKGHPEEQKLKVDSSGLAIYFGHTAIVKEKDVAAYQAIVAERNLSPEKVWMIGNSPKSDINPALAAGLNAAYVPHDRTWHLEKTDFAEASPSRLLLLSSFRDLTIFF